MALTPLNISEELRPWRAVGVSYLLVEPVSTEETVVDSTTIRGGTANSLESVTVSSFEPVAGGSRGLGGKGAAPVELRFSEKPETGGTHTALSPASVTGSKSLLTANVPPENWPASWQKFLPKKRGSLLLWSYKELATDLSGSGDKRRGACLRDIISYLEMPGGTSVFWPVALPEGIEFSEETVPGSHIFHSGINFLNPKVVIFLGAESLKKAGIQDEFNGQPYNQRILGGRFFLLLPSFSIMLSSPNELQKAKTYLKQVLAPLRQSYVR